MTPAVTYYDADYNRLDCTSCGRNVQTLTNSRCAVCDDLGCLAASCAHVYVTSDGQCLHCGTDVSQQLAAAGLALNAEITRQLASSPHSPGKTPHSTGRGVPISTAVSPFPRLGGLPFTRSSFRGFFGVHRGP